MVDRVLLEFAANFIVETVSESYGLYIHQENYEHDVNALIEKGCMPAGYYKLIEAMKNDRNSG